MTRKQQNKNQTSNKIPNGNSEAKSDVVLDIKECQEQLKYVKNILNLSNNKQLQIHKTCDDHDISNAQVIIELNEIYCVSFPTAPNNKRWKTIVNNQTRKIINYIRCNDVLCNRIPNNYIDTRLLKIYQQPNITEVKESFIDNYIGIIYTKYRNGNNEECYNNITDVLCKNSFKSKHPETFYGKPISQVNTKFIIENIYKYRLCQINPNGRTNPNTFFKDDNVDGPIHLSQTGQIQKNTILYITTEHCTVAYNSQFADSIVFSKEYSDSLIEWQVEIINGFTDINHLCAKVTFTNIKCSLCCIGLQWRRCGEKDQYCYICDDSRNYYRCLHFNYDSTHICDKKEIEGNFATDLEIQKECPICGVNIGDLKIKSPIDLAISKFKQIIEFIPDLISWGTKFILANINFIISLSVINLNHYLIDYTEISDKMFTEMFSKAEKFLFGWNIMVVLLSFILLIIFLKREMCVIHVLVNKNNDNFIKALFKNRFMDVKRDDRGNIKEESIIYFKKVCRDWILLIGLMISFSLCFISLVYFCYLGSNGYILIFIVIIMFKIKFMIDCWVRFINLNMYRICSADKYKICDVTKDISNDYNITIIRQLGNNSHKHWLLYYCQNH